MAKYGVYLLAILGVLWAAVPVYAQMTPQASAQTSLSYNLEANQVSRDEARGLTIAEGDVVVTDGAHILMAQRLILNDQTKTMRAEGDVSLLRPSGEVFFARSLDLSQDFGQGAAEALLAAMGDGSQLVAVRGEVVRGQQTVLTDARYTPCEICETGDDPTWNLRAGRVIYDEAAQNIIYHNVRLEVLGVPVGYVPYFSHPSPEVTQRSGMLMPRVSFDSKLGTAVRTYTYWGIAEDRDATIELTHTSRQGSLLGIEGRRQFDQGWIEAKGSINRSTVRGGISSDGDVDDDDISKGEKWRGHIFVKGAYQLDDAWSASMDIKRSFDDQYLRDFDFENSDILTNSMAVTYVQDRDYFDVRGLYFQDLRPDIDISQPDMLPWVTAETSGVVDGALGGRWSLGGEALSLWRQGRLGVMRASVTPSWTRHDIWQSGLETQVMGRVLTDFYWVQNRPPEDPINLNGDDDTTQWRVVPQAQLRASYPLVRPSGWGVMRVEPLTALTLTPERNIDEEIPNEDARDLQLDLSNLFLPSRFAGRDRVESGSHLSYGLRVGTYQVGMVNSLVMTVGQSYRLSDDDTPASLALYPTGSGLEERYSDWVGQVAMTVANRLYGDYRFQLDQDDFGDRRHELSLAYDDGYTLLQGSYLMAEELDGTDLPAARQQVTLDIAQYLTDRWWVFGGGRVDLSGDAGLLETTMGAEYRDDCFRLRLAFERDLTDRTLGGGEDRVIFSIGLRNLGGYSEPFFDDDRPIFDYGTSNRATPRSCHGVLDALD